ncbi:MAG: molybdopterin-dependent oxidoreductase, partial [Dehalococcoidia bacterium]|nr:molybdopterin-dependent oxidoreductase [Dehalococcoidia bacterium]
RGSKLIVIDPWETGYARRANIWIKPRPCSDLALALGMINVIINEGLYDKDFVENWTVGFDRLKANIQDYPPDRVAEITWVPAETIREVARFYATNKPACIAWGNGLDNNINNFQGDRAICILRAITGNLGKPGGDLEWSQSGIVPKYSQEMIQQGAIPPEVRARRLKPRDTIVPPFYYAIPQDIIKAIATGEPYPVRTVFVQGASLLHTYTNSRETYEALKRLDFLTVTDFFMTPTAELADIVLPVATYLEIDSLHLSEYTPTVSVIQKVAQVGECRSDYEILKELAKRLGLGKYFWDDTEQVLDYILKPTGLTYDEFRKVGVIRGSKQYRKHEKSGFSTPSGKVELYSKKLEEWGFDPLPVFHEPPESPYSEPQLAKEYPLVLTNRKLAHFQHSGGRQLQTLRGIHPEPLTYLHPETASKLGVAEGDYVYIETKRGRVKQKAALAPGIDRRVVFLDYGWWFPEKDAELHGWAESNINILTSNKQPYAREMGSATLRGILCKVYKAT